MNDDLLYHERLTSNRTEALFLAFTLLFFLLLFWRVLVAGHPCQPFKETI